MMMARDSTPERPALSDAALADLRSALVDFLADGNHGALEKALAAVAHDARDKKMHAEQLLVALKEVWFSLPPVVNARESDEQNRALQRVISICIREYYS